MANRGLIVVDMISPYDFGGAERLAANAERVVPVIAGLIGRARDEGRPLVYVNDNYGHWNSSRDELLELAMEGERPDLVEPLAPRHDDVFVVKARHSIFYGSPVEYLLNQLDVGRLVLTGQATEQCILYSALDAYVRNFKVTVVRDACAPLEPRLGEASLELMERNMDAELVDAEAVTLEPY